ncbi:MAG: hypothetical protein HC807_08625 [Gammaproteobacteria bacterium]|nr:hypothetical protein [Gammaproteobacteria bacterium]
MKLSLDPDFPESMDKSMNQNRRRLVLASASLVPTLLAAGWLPARAFAQAAPLLRKKDSFERGGNLDHRTRDGKAL